MDRETKFQQCDGIRILLKQEHNMVLPVGFGALQCAATGSQL